jgi:hypothetical protein
MRANQFVSILRAVKSSKDSTFNTELVHSVIMPDGTEHKLDYDPSKPEDVADLIAFLAPLYTRAGYEIFGTLEQFPNGHSRHFLHKRLRAA